MDKRIVRISEQDLHEMVKETLLAIITEGTHIKTLYHKAPVSVRKSILTNGLIPSVGDSYKAHYEYKENLKPYIFLYDHNSVNGGEYDSTYDDDIYAIDLSKIDASRIRRDPDKGMRGCYTYDETIPATAIRLVYKGSKKDAGDLSLHSSIY